MVRLALSVGTLSTFDYRRQAAIGTCHVNVWSARAIRMSCKGGGHDPTLLTHVLTCVYDVIACPSCVPFAYDHFWWSSVLSASASRHSETAEAEAVKNL